MGECFGTPLTECKYNKFYLPIHTTDSMLFGRFVAEFGAPILTTPLLSSAMMNGDGNGYIIELRGIDSRVSCFRMSLFSKLMHKEEVLFCGGTFPLRICNIVHVPTFCNYQHFVSALSMLDAVLCGLSPDEKPTKLDLQLMVEILQSNLGGNDGNDGMKKKDGFWKNDYLRNLFEYFIIFVKRICVHFYWIEEHFKPLIGILVDDEMEKMVLIGNIVTIFENVECLEVDGGPQGIEANEGYLNVLLKRLDALDKECSLKRIELRNAHFEEELVFDQMMEPFFNAGFDVNIQRTEFDRTLVFEAIEE